MAKRQPCWCGGLDTEYGSACCSTTLFDLLMATRRSTGKQRVVVHIVFQPGVLITNPHVQDVMQVLLARLACTGFSLVFLSVQAGSCNVFDCTALSIGAPFLVLTALSICSVSPTIAVVRCLQELVLGGN